MKNNLHFTKLALCRRGVYRFVGMIFCLMVVAGSIGVTGCGRKSQAQEDEANLKLVGYDLDQKGLFKAVKNDDVQALQIFKERGVDLNQQNEQGRTAAYFAAVSGSVRALHFLVKHGAELEAADEDGVTPLMAAAKEGRAENSEVITYLLEKGADAMRKDKIGKFALIHAIDGKSMETIHLIAPKSQQLLDTGLLYAADLDHHETIPVLVKYGASVYARSGGKTSLMIAAERGNEKSVKALLDEGSNLYAVSDEGKLAQDYAEGNEKVLAVLGESETETESNSLAIEWSEEELEDLVQKAMDKTEVEEVLEVGEYADARDNIITKDGNNVSNVDSNNEAGIVMSEAPKREVILQSISGKNLPLELGDDVVVEKQMIMAAYAEKSLPLKVNTDDGGRIQIIDLRLNKVIQAEQGAGVVVKEGSQIGMTGLRVKQIRKKIVNNKLTDGYDKELVTLLIEDEKSGKIKEIYVGDESQVADGVAVIRLNGSGEYMIVKRGDEFYDLNGKPYKVMDVNDEEVIIENLTSGKQDLLPLMGIKR